MTIKKILVGIIIILIFIVPSDIFPQENIITILIRERATLQQQAAVIRGFIVTAEEMAVTRTTYSSQRWASNNTALGITATERDSAGLASGIQTLSALRSELSRRESRIEQLNTEILLLITVLQNQDAPTIQQGQIFN